MREEIKNKLKTTILYLTVFVNGAVVLIVEILGTRVIGPFFGSTIFVWSAMLSVALGFLALGYWIGGLIADRKTKSSVLYLIVILAGFFTAVVMKVDQPILVFTDKFGIQFGPLVAATILFAVPLTFFGMVSPFAIRLQADKLNKVGGTAGRIFAVATIGSLVGALASGFFLVPNFAISRIVVWSGLSLATLATFGLLLSSDNWRNGLMAIFVAGAGSASIAYAGPIKFVDTRYTSKIIHEEPNFLANTKVIDVSNVRCLIMDSSQESCKSIGNSDEDRFVTPYIGEFARIANEDFDEGNILLLGIGTGTFFEELQGGKKIDAVDIDPKVVELGKRFFGLKENSYTNLIISDARNYLKTTDKKYDLIIYDIFSSDVPPPHLLTQEFFKLLKTRLNDNGVVLVNINGYGNGSDPYTNSVLKTLRSVFNSVVLTATNPEESVPMIVQLSNHGDYVPNVGGQYKRVDFSTKTNGLLLTDDYAPIDQLVIKDLVQFRENIKSYAGYQVLFVN